MKIAGGAAQGKASAVKARINPNKLARLHRNRALGILVSGCGRAGQPKVISRGIDDQPGR